MVTIEKTSLNMDDYVQSMLQSFHANKDFVNFIKSPYEPLVIKLSKPKKIRSLRVSLNSTDFLHIHSIVFLDENDRLIKIPKGSAQVEASSYYADSKKRIAEHLLFQPNSEHVWSIHTNREKNPSILISLKEPIRVSRIIIKNRLDINALRTATLSVSIRQPYTPKWKIVLRSDQLGFNSVRRRYHLSNINGGQSIHNAVAYAITGDYMAAHKHFQSVPEIFKSALLQAVNGKILVSRELEWSGNHGIRRTFRFWGLVEKRHFIKMTSQVVNDLQSLSKDVSLGFGSAMAAVRDQDLIPHDDDTDIMIAFKPSQAKSFKEAKLLVKQHLIKQGYELTGEFYNHWHVRRDGFKADVFVGIYESNNTIGWYPHPRNILKRSDMFPAETVDLLGVPCLIPKNAERYLSVIYGNTWRIPDPTWAPNWNKKKYEDLA